MSDTHNEGCVSGAVRYDMRGETIVVIDWQWQRQKGAGRSSDLTFQTAEAAIEGTAGLWLKTVEGGTDKSCAFCPTRLSPLHITVPDAPDLFAPRARSLDDPSRYRP